MASWSAKFFVTFCKLENFAYLLDDEDVFGGGGRDVDVVYSGAGSSYNFELLAGGDYISCYFCV